jgi:diguanylate cyclase (GGDEF)-like protein
VVRIGGDEFAALLPDTDAAAESAVRSRVEAACEAWRGTEPAARLSLSLGSAVPAPGERLRDAFRRADAAMYESKRAT